MTEKKTFSFNNYAKIPNVRYNLQDRLIKLVQQLHLLLKMLFLVLSLSAEKLKLFINESDSEENENNVNVTG